LQLIEGRTFDSHAYLLRCCEIDARVFHQKLNASMNLFDLENKNKGFSRI